jgi:hypothetical protein
MVVLYALLDRRLDELIEFFPSLEKAEEVLQAVLRDEPQWAGTLDVLPVELSTSMN